MNDIAEARSIAVVRTRLPYIDRRSLSQAWFSALRIADAVPVARAGHATKSATPALRSTTRAAPSSRLVPTFTTPAAKSARVAVAARRGDASADVAAQPSRRLQHARAQPARSPVTRTAQLDGTRSYPPFQTSLTVGVEGARVALLLRREGPTLHVVALCAPANVELVRRALACADAHLRLRGDSVRASVRSTAEVRA